jgi:hypothetical protein
VKKSVSGMPYVPKWEQQEKRERKKRSVREITIYGEHKELLLCLENR